MVSSAALFGGLLAAMASTGLAIEPISPTPACTTSIAVYPTMVSRSDGTCEYPGATTTVRPTYNCHGCAHITASTVRMGPGPVCVHVATDYASTATVTSPQCAPTPVPEAAADSNAKRGIATSTSQCTTTYFVEPTGTPHFGTCTSYSTYVTSTTSVDCHGCSLTQGHMGPGPICTSLVVGKTGTITTAACAKSTHA